MSLGSILGTSYRYEIDLHGPNYFARRTCIDERIAAEVRRMESLRHDARMENIMAKRDWAFNMEPKIAYNNAERSRKLITREASIENKASILVRRAALRHQLQLDYRQYQRELREQNKALFFQRF